MKNLLTLALLFSAFFTYAQEVEEAKETAAVIEVIEAEEAPANKKFSLGGSADAYFRQNIGAPNGSEAIAPNTSFANQNGFALGMANAILSYEGKKVGAVVDLVFGPRGEEAVFESSPSNNIVNQLYVYWNVSDAVTLTFGNFNTFLGYEVISPVGNFNYSTSYMFSYGPFSHTGLKLDWAINDDWSFLGAIMNNNDYTDFNPTNDYTVGAQIGYKDVYLNFLYGPQFQIDLTTGFDLTDSFYLGVNSTYYINNDTDGSFYGVALYPQYQATESFAIGLRAEYFGEGDYGVGAIGAYDEDGNANAFEFTLSGNIAIGDLMLIPEFRIDTTSEDTFVNNDFEPTGSLTSFVFAAVYSF